MSDARPRVTASARLRYLRGAHCRSSAGEQMRKSFSESSQPQRIGEGPWHRAQSSTTRIKVERSFVPSTAPCNSEVWPAYTDILSSFQCAKWALAAQLHEMSGHQIRRAWSRRSAPMHNCCRPDLRKLYVLIGSLDKRYQLQRTSSGVQLTSLQNSFDKEDMPHALGLLLLSAFIYTMYA